jgi:hypothetical protein
MVTYYLQRTLTVTGNSYGFSGTDIQFNLDTAMTKIIERLDRIYGGQIDRARSKSNRDSYAVSTIIIDLKQMRHFFDLTGTLSNSSGTMSSDKYNTTVLQNGASVNDTAVNKKNLLIAFVEQGGPLYLFHRNFGSNRPTGTAYPENATATTEMVFITTMQFEDIETEVGASEVYMKEGEQRISFTMTLRRGKER